MPLAVLQPTPHAPAQARRKLLMPLSEMSPNVPEMDPTGRKRSHDEYAGTIVKAVDDVDATTPKALSLQPTGDVCEFA